MLTSLAISPLPPQVPSSTYELPDYPISTSGFLLEKWKLDKITGYFDLGRPCLKIGLCNARQSILGYKRHEMLKSSGVETAVIKHTAVQVPIANFWAHRNESG